jgi:hypothetical protein
MLPSRRFWYNLGGSVLLIAAQWFIVGIFFVAYLPTFGGQPIDQKITIVVALANAAVAFALQIAMVVVSMMYERPSRQQEW